MTGQVPTATPTVVFDEQLVPTLVGRSATAGPFRVGGASVVTGPDGMLIVTEAGDDPARSGVWSAGEASSGRHPRPSPSDS
ncbi:hypothetical protein [Streptomyces venezuelae]|uniref:hypothetical protein n=1 Tax=Streptomyces venezuelae TaxID=54571 RepID=UPI00333181C5